MSIFQLLASKDQYLLVRRNSFLILDLVFTFSIVSEGSTSRVMVFPVRVFTKICILAEVPSEGEEKEETDETWKYRRGDDRLWDRAPGR